MIEYSLTNKDDMSPMLAPGPVAGTTAGTFAAGDDPRLSPAVSVPTDLARRVTFGAYANTGGTTQFAALETALGVKISRYVSYQTMATGGSSGWSSAEADWCKSTGHDLVIAWDILSGGPTFANILSGANNASLDAFFTAAKNYGAPVTLRMWWEMNDVNGPTKVGNASSALFASSTVSARRAEWIAAWQYVYNRCKVTNGAKNVNFFFCANGSDTGATTVEQLWPGAAYVDVIGLDTYNETTFASWTSFTAKIAPMMNRLAALAPSLPQGIGELGTVDTGGPAGTSKATWLQDMFASADWPKLTFVDYFSVNQTNDWRLDQTAASIAAVRSWSTAARYDPDVVAARDSGLLGWTLDPAAAVGSLQTTAGVLHLMEIRLRAGTVNTLHVRVGTAGATLTSGQNFLALFDSTGARVGLTADQSTAWTTTGTKSAALTTPYAATGGVFYVAILSNGTTQPTFIASSSLGQPNFTRAAPFRTATLLTGQTSIPSSVTLGSSAALGQGILVGAA